MQYCPTCRKPIYNHLVNTTVTTCSSVWPYCQCPTVYTLRYTISNGTASYTLVPVDESKPAVPKAFYDAFEGKELEP